MSDKKYGTVSDAIDALEREYLCATVFIAKDGESAVVDTGWGWLYVSFEGAVHRLEDVV